MIAGLVASVGVAHAESAEELQARGERLAKDAHYSEAIEAFKAADAIAPSAAHKCFIALAYTRRELWPQAEIFIARCVGEQLPLWVTEARALIAARIAEARVAPVTIVVDPAGVDARLSVSSFAPDETFAPGQTIHLPPGHHVIVTNAPGYERDEQAIDIGDKGARQLIVRLYRPGERAQLHQPVHRSALPRRLMIAGTASIGAGIVAYGVMGLGWYELRRDNGANFHNGYNTAYDVGRAASLSLWTVGGALVVTGYLLNRRDHHDEAPVAALAPLPGGVALAIGWRR